MNNMTTISVQTGTPRESENARRKRLVREASNWKKEADVDWDDMDHFISNCKRLNDTDSFDTAIRVLQALKKQITGQ